MVKFDSTSFGSVTIDGKKYEDVLVVENEVTPRDKDKLRTLYGTSHVVRKEEAAELLKGDPDVVIIGTGQYGALSVDDKVAQLLRSSAELIITVTPQAIEEYNRLSATKKVNALIHTTC